MQKKDECFLGGNYGDAGVFFLYDLHIRVFFFFLLEERESPSL